MAISNVNEIKESIAKFLPESLQENPFVKALSAGAAAISILMATPAFAPIGVVGATGWIVVYIVAGGTLTLDIVKKAWSHWMLISQAERDSIDNGLVMLKKLRDDGALSEDDYKLRVSELIEKKFK